MSTRVQKGGTIFKPVAKGRSHPPPNAARNSTTPAPQHPVIPVQGQQDDPTLSSATPPPPTIPTLPVAPIASSNGTTSYPDTLPVLDKGVPRTASASPIATPHLRSVEPAVARANTVSNNTAQSLQFSPAPLTTPSVISNGVSSVVTALSLPIAIGSRAAPIILTSSSPVPRVSLAAEPPSVITIPTPYPPLPVTQRTMSSHARPSSISLPSNDLQFDFSTLAHPDPGQDPTNSSPSRLQLNSESVIKAPRPRRKTVRNDVAAPQGDLENAPDFSEVKPKRTRARQIAEAVQDSANSQTLPNRPQRMRRAPKAIIETFEHGDDDWESGPKKRKRRASGDNRVRRKPRAATSPPYDPGADPEEELDPTVTTMAALCEESSQGRASSKAAQIYDNHATWKRVNRERRARMRALMEAKKYGRDDEDGEGEGLSATPIADGPSNTPPNAVPSGSMSNGAEVEAEAGEGEDSQGFDYSQSLNTSRFNVQVRIGPNGETIVDEESLFVDRADDQDTANYTHIEESDATKFVNSASYAKKFRGSRWSAEETELFYDALSQFGENYELISYILPGRDRKSCKNKFKAEDKKNPNRITYCLNNRVPYDMKTLSRMTGKDFSGPTPVIIAPVRPNLAQLSLHTAAPSQAGTINPTDQDNAPSRPSSAAGSRAHAKKHGRKKDDGVEVLGAIDSIDWD